MKRLVLAFALLAVCCIANGAAPGDAPALKAGEFTPPRIAPGFSLAGSNGDAVSLEQFRGKVVLLGFGYTSCIDVCPVTLATLAAALRALGERALDVQVVYVTVDPARDDAARMKEYLARFHPSFVGATGTEPALEAVRREYGIAAKKIARPAGDYLYGHSSFVYLIDRSGRLRALMPYGRPAADFVHDAEVLLAAP